MNRRAARRIVRSRGERARRGKGKGKGKAAVLPPGRRVASPRLPAGRHGLPREFIAQNQRERIITALVDTVAERGYNATTVAHITKAASVSRRTFYEHFADKEACFLAAYEMVADHIRDSMQVAAEAFERVATAGAGRAGDDAALPRRRAGAGPPLHDRAGRRRAARSPPATEPRCRASSRSSRPDGPTTAASGRCRRRPRKPWSAASSP